MLRGGTNPKISRPLEFYQLVQLYNAEDTLGYLWTTSPETLTGIACPQIADSLAHYCYSVVANTIDKRFPLLPVPEQPAKSPLVVRWRNHIHESDGSYAIKFPRYMAQSLKEASALSYARMYAASKSHGQHAFSVFRRISHSQTHEIEPNQSDVDVGMLFDFRLAKSYDDFAPGADFIFVEAKGKDGLWRCAYSPPGQESASKTQKRAHIKKAFKSWGYHKMTKEVDDLWDSLRLTKCKVSWQTATPSDYAAACRALPLPSQDPLASTPQVQPAVAPPPAESLEEAASSSTA